MTTTTHTGQRVSAVAASALITAAGGALDAWVYLAHGHVFANAQTGNVALMMIAVADRHFAQAGSHLTSLAAFVAGIFISRQTGDLLKRMVLNSRDVRLAAECVFLTVLGFAANALSDHAIVALVGFIAGLQITSLSHIGAWSFNTGMTTGNLRGALSAFSKALTGSGEEWPHALVMAALCIAFGVGALAGAWLTPRLEQWTVLPIAGLVAATIAAAPRGLDPIPEWKNLQ